MTICAVVRASDNVAINKIVADPTDPAPDGCFLIDVTNMWMDIGWIWNGSVFVEPTESV